MSRSSYEDLRHTRRHTRSSIRVTTCNVSRSEIESLSSWVSLFAHIDLFKTAFQNMQNELTSIAVRTAGDRKQRHAAASM